MGKIANTLFGDDSIEIEIGGLAESNSWTFEVETEQIQAESVPEPSTIIGLFLVGGLGLSLKRKKQS